MSISLATFRDRIAHGINAMEERKMRVGRVRFPVVGDSYLYNGKVYDIVSLFWDYDMGCNIADCCGFDSSIRVPLSDVSLVGTLVLGNSSTPSNIWSNNKTKVNKNENQR